MGNKVWHIQAHRSFWSGRVTAYCGWSSEPGRYDTPGWFSSGQTCPACKRLEKQHKQDKKGGR